MVTETGLEKKRKAKKKMKIFCYMDDNLTEKTGASLPTSENERASDTTNEMASPLFIDKRPSIGWTYQFIYRADGER